MSDDLKEETASSEVTVMIISYHIIDIEISLFRFFLVNKSLENIIRLIKKRIFTDESDRIGKRCQCRVTRFMQGIECESK